MAIAFRAAGTVSFAGPSTDATPGVPSGTAADDIMVAVVLAGNDNSLTFPAGWTKKVERTNGTAHRLTVAWKRATSSESAPSISGNSQDIIAQIFGFSGCTASGDPFNAFDSQANASSTTVTAPTITPANADSMILFVGGRSNQGATTSTFSGYSGTNPTFAEGFDNANTSGAVVFDLAIFGAYGTKNDTTATGSRTATASNAGENSAALLALTPAAGGSSTTATPGVGAVTLQGKTPTTSAFQNVRIRQVLVNESGQAVANAANITLLVWYSGVCRGAPDVSLNGMTSDANGTTSWSIATGTLSFQQPIFYVAQDSISFSNYTCARLIPNYE